MFTVTYTPAGGESPDDDIIATGIRTLSIMPQSRRGAQQVVQCNFGVGGGGQFSNGFAIPISQIVSIEAEES